MDKLRLYSFVNHIYMGPAQWGIQTGHAISTLMASHDADQRPAQDSQAFDQRRRMGLEWARKCPTLMVMQGGNVAMLLDLETRLGELCGKLNLPFSTFREDEQSLGGVITCVAALIPDSIFGLQAKACADGALEFTGSLDAEPSFKPFSPCPITAQSQPELHALLTIVKLARFAGM